VKPKLPILPPGGKRSSPRDTRGTQQPQKEAYCGREGGRGRREIDRKNGDKTLLVLDNPWLLENTLNFLRDGNKKKIGGAHPPSSRLRVPQVKPDGREWRIPKVRE